MTDRTVRVGGAEAETDPDIEESSVVCMLLPLPSPCGNGPPQFQNEEGKKVWRSEGGG
jgi:hypothetical protein